MGEPSFRMFGSDFPDEETEARTIGGRENERVMAMSDRCRLLENGVLGAQTSESGLKPWLWWGSGDTGLDGGGGGGDGLVKGREGVATFDVAADEAVASFANYREPFRELVQNPWEREPDFADNRDELQDERIGNWTLRHNGCRASVKR